jgi:hypothetical protein
MAWMARQGDILIVAITGEPPTSAREIAREPGGIVLAHGEATGHAHRIRSQHARFLENNGERFLRIDEPADLTHEEHAPIHLVPGAYRVVRQREYVPPREDATNPHDPRRIEDWVWVED